MRVIYRTIGRRIREERKRSKLTIEQLAELAGISTSFLAYIERRERRARLETLARLADVLRIPIGNLLESKERRPMDDVSDAAQEFVQLIRGLRPDAIRMVLDVVKAIISIVRPGNNRRSKK